MERQALYSIGHGNRKAEDFLALLKDYEIRYLVDVRSQPYSKFNPQFNREELKLFLERNGIRYVFMGDSLGGRPKDKSCYYKNGRVNYDLLKAKNFFISGIKRLKTAYENNIPAAIMCSETRPAECHRTKLIGCVLRAKHIYLQHIDELGQIKDQRAVINELNRGFNKNLFDINPD